MIRAGRAPRYGETGAMIDFLLRNGSRSLLWLRYRLRISGLDAVARRGTQGILFLPNHPALIDPMIVMTVLHKQFRPRAVADSDRMENFALRWLYRRLGILPIPSIAKHGPGARAEIERVLAEAVEGVKRGDNLLLYPAGHIYRHYLEDLRGNSGVETILRQAPDIRVVLVRIGGLWGSGFSWASGRPPSAARVLKKGAVCLLLNGLFFSPRREVTIEFSEPADLPRTAGRAALNPVLESFYNQGAGHNTYVPYTLWERRGRAELPEPERPRLGGAAETIPAATRHLVTRHLQDLAGRAPIRDEEHLALDLGLDSLSRTELLVWLEQEFGLPQGDADALHTVGDVLLAACGEAVSSEFSPLKPISPKWFAEAPENPPLVLPSCATLTEAFLHQARQMPGKVIVADQAAGAKTYRDLVLGILALRPQIERLAGDRVGILLPASVAADVVYLATLFAGKVPVMINWTVGRRALAHCLDLVDVRHILTSEALVSALGSRGIDLEWLGERLVSLERWRRGASLAAKVGALAKSRLSWASLERAAVPETAAILFTSGSESLPKAVPLTHRNILANLGGVLAHVTFRENDRMIGFLPPFHALGLTATTLFPLCLGLRTVHHANPTQGAILARLIETYRASVVVATPTFLSGILRASTEGQLASFRLAFVGAERCPEQVYDALAERCPRAQVLEGYGVTECSPIISANVENAAQRATIGRLLPSYERLLLHAETGQRVEPPGTGVLHVRGPSVFAGYLNYAGTQPFTEIDGKSWYRTGDLVSEDGNGVLTFRGRLKRFIKLGGEMISLPAIEAVLGEHYASEADQGPAIAVEATPDDVHPEIVLFATADIDRAAANRQLQEAGLSPLHNIRRVVRLAEIPVLGTGKTDYGALKARLRG